MFRWTERGVAGRPKCWVLFVVFFLQTLGDSSNALNSHWCPKMCDCYNQYTTVDCTNKGLTSLPPISNRTHYLFLDGNNITSLPGDAFRNSPNLVKLHIQNSGLTSVTSLAFCALQELEEIHLGNNKLTNFQVIDQAHCVLPKLNKLILNGNYLSQVPRYLSTFAPNLELLNLSTNELESVKLDESFSRLHSLECLDFSQNAISNILENDLDEIREGALPLVDLRFTDCRMAYMHPRALRGLDNLTVLTLSDSLVALDEVFSTFRPNITKMAHLDISHMYLPTIRVNMVGMFRKLLLLKAVSSDVNQVETGVFDQLQDLETLHFEMNNLVSLDNINSARSLRRLYLSHNKLSYLDLRNLTSLETIDLSHNQFRSIPRGWLSGIKDMLTLNFSSNEITEIDGMAFTSLSMNILDLSYNEIETLSSFGSMQLRKLDLSHNGLSTIYQGAFVNITNNIGELDLGHNELWRLPLGIFRGFQNLQRLCLGHNNLGEALKTGQLRDLFLSLGHLQELDLSHNGIQSLPLDQLRTLHHLTTLFLDGNNIANLTTLYLTDLPSLAKLVLSDNHLPSIETDVLSELGFLEVIDLSANPYDCTCNIYPFLDWLKTTRAVVLGLKVRDNYLCDFPPQSAGMYVLDPEAVPTTTSCLLTSTTPGIPTPTAHRSNRMMHRLAVAGIVIGGVIVLCVIAALVLYFGQLCQQIKKLHYRWQVRYREVSGVEIAGDIKA